MSDTKQTLESDSAAAAGEQYVCFKLANEEYALNIADVQEVIRIQKIRPVSQMPEFVLGVINLRGNIIPVFDLRRKFGLPLKELDYDTKIVVALIEDTTISFVVDEILDNIRFHESQIDPAPSINLMMDRECIKGIAEEPGRMVIIIDVASVFVF